MPIEIGGVLGWGVEDRRLGLDAADQVREDWSIRYTVESEAGVQFAQALVDGVALAPRRLVRQVLNEQDEVVRTDPVVDQLSSGAAKPGFRVERVGDVWELRIATQVVDQDTPCLDTVIHVVTRN
jgi:DNA-binding transcriptional LysR family regulator